MASSFVTPWTVAHPAPLSMGFPRQEFWGGLPFPSPGGLTIQGLSLCLLHGQVDSLLLSHQGSTERWYKEAKWRGRSPQWACTRAKKCNDSKAWAPGGPGDFSMQCWDPLNFENWENWGTGKLSNLPQITQLSDATAGYGLRLSGLGVRACNPDLSRCYKHVLST